MFSAATKSGKQASAANYIEDVFSTYLYNGNEPNSVTVNNGIDLSTKGGLVWIKARETAKSNWLWDTARGTGSGISSNTTGAAVSFTGVSAFNTNGFTVGPDAATNDSTRGMVSWTFRKQAKFFDVVTFYQNGGVTVNHNLGSVPACIIIKSTSAADNWYVYHTSLNAPNGNGPRYNYLSLNSTASATNAGGIWINNITSTSFDITNQVVAPFQTYVAYLFAHNAGGFGLTGTDNVISCGSYTGTGSVGLNVTLGYEPQWVLIKRTDVAGSNWFIQDVMRGFSQTQTAILYPNLSDAESTATVLTPTATGFQLTGTPTGYNANGGTYIYIAIRRGPMKTPTDGTSVFSIGSVPNGSSAQRFTGNFFDLDVHRNLSSTTDDWRWADKLRGISSVVGGNGQYVASNNAGAEITLADSIANKTSSLGVSGFDNAIRAYLYTGQGGVQYGFRRAPGFFDEVCYTGTGSNLTVSHNLTVAPQLIIIKNRTNGWSWNVGYDFGVSSYSFLTLDNSDPGTSNPYSSHYTAAPTSTQFFLGTNIRVNQSSANFVAYLFASCPGVSKVGSYTGNGSTQTINCGFTGGARFVLIKRTDSAGDWYVYDTARGMTSVTDPYLLLNSTAAESATLGSVTTVSTGFALNASILAAINTNGASYIFLAIA